MQKKQQEIRFNFGENWKIILIKYELSKYKSNESFGRFNIKKIDKSFWILEVEVDYFL